MEPLEKIGQLLAAKNGVKNGMQTTEFWITAIPSVISLLDSTLPAPWNLVIPCVLGGLYMLSRALVKAAHELGRAKQIPDLPALPEK